MDPSACMCPYDILLLHMLAHTSAGLRPRPRLLVTALLMLPLHRFAVAKRPPTRPLMKTPNKRERVFIRTFLIGRTRFAPSTTRRGLGLAKLSKHPPYRAFLNAEQFRLSLLRLGTFIRQTQIHDSSKWYRNCSLKRSLILAPYRRIRPYSGEPPTATWAFSWLLLSRNALGCPAPSGRA